MSLRFTPEDAERLGLISQDEAVQIRNGMRQHARPRSRASSSSSSSTGRRNVDPQQILFQALCARLPGLPVAEKEGLVPGRKFRADVFIAPNIVVEMDGYQYHSSKSAFQKDHQRDNLMAAHGYRVFRTFTKEVLDAASLGRLVELIAGVVEGAGVSVTSPAAVTPRLHQTRKVLD